MSPFFCSPINYSEHPKIAPKTPFCWEVEVLLNPITSFWSKGLRTVAVYIYVYIYSI